MPATLFRNYTKASTGTPCRIPFVTCALNSIFDSPRLRIDHRIKIKLPEQSLARTLTTPRSYIPPLSSHLFPTLRSRFPASPCSVSIPSTPNSHFLSSNARTLSSTRLLSPSSTPPRRDHHPAQSPALRLALTHSLDKSLRISPNSSRLPPPRPRSAAPSPRQFSTPPATSQTSHRLYNTLYIDLLTHPSHSCPFPRPRLSRPVSSRLYPL
mmetsp:Transcript_3571/g.10975  ORF Transcript_3571/g.10975 Transcript_3571/m.10975 type:complete len:211 (+) Transcript_3571:209-841(+)